MHKHYRASRAPLGLFKSFVYGIAWAFLASMSAILMFPVAKPGPIGTNAGWMAIGVFVVICGLGTWSMAERLVRGRYLVAFAAGWWLLALPGCYGYLTVHSMQVIYRQDYPGPPLASSILAVAGYALVIGGLIAAVWLGHRHVWGTPCPHERDSLCQACGYNLTGNESGNCPECGADTPGSRQHPVISSTDEAHEDEVA